MPLALSLRDRVDSEVHSQARSQAQVVATAASESIVPPQLSNLTRLARTSAESVRGRVIVVNAAGRLLADSAGAPRGRDYASRPEVAAALAGEEEQINRNSETLGTEILATATPVIDRGRVAGAVRITQSIDAINRAVRTSILDVGGLALVVLLLGLIAGALIAAQIARPIRRLDRAARQVAGGDLDATVAIEGSSEQRSLARAFNEMTGRVKRLLRVQQDFVADASHQLRTPLTGLRLRLEALGEELGGEDAAAADVEAAMREIDRLSLIVDELLILSRAGEHELPGERLDLGAAARRAAERWTASAAEHGVELELRGGAADGAAWGWCAGPDLDRSIDVLVENALLYSPAGSTVTVTAAPGRVEVLDRGPGLAPGEEEAVCERFSRGSAGRRGPRGTGLGLPIARELTRQWGGEVRLTPREGGGLQAIIELNEEEPRQ
ncbi:MAG: HAMP domain-containing sensor histidine kinase [Solirubrobacterales bacterium]